MRNALADVIKAIEEFNGTAASLEDNLPDISIEDQVALGQKLWNLSRKAMAALEPLKGCIRDEAVLRQKGTPGTVQFDARDGSRCRVVLSTPTLEIRKGADMESIKSLMKGQFHYLFKTTVSYRPRMDFKDQVGNVNPKAQQAVLDAVDIVPGTPKVFFED